MGSSLANKAARKIFAKNLENYTPVDPLYETYTDKKGKQRRRKVCVLSLLGLALV